MSRSHFLSLDEAFKWVAGSIVECGAVIAPRGLPTRELRAVHFSIEDPRRRYVSLAARRWSFPYALGEFCWHARGSNRLDEISFYASRWQRMSEDSETIRASCYGAKIFVERPPHVSQWVAARNTLIQDPASRRAVLSIAAPLDETVSQDVDVSCATSLQFSVRSGKLEAIANMRSNDAILGLPYDIFLFTMLQEMIAVELRVELGPYHHFVGSLHIYDSDLDWARQIARATQLVGEPMPPMRNLGGLQNLLEGERRTRKGLPLESDTGRSDEYWSDLLSVLNYRNTRHFGRSALLEAVVANPLYQQLTRLHQG